MTGNPERFYIAVDELSGVEMDEAMELAGISAEDMERKAMSLTCAAAIIHAKRTHPDVDESLWRRLKISELERLPEPDDQSPTEPVS